MTSSNSSNIFPYMDMIITGFYNNRCLKSGDAVHRWSQDMATYIPALLRDLRKRVYATPAVRCYRSSLTPGVLFGWGIGTSDEANSLHFSRSHSQVKRDKN